MCQLKHTGSPNLLDPDRRRSFYCGSLAGISVCLMKDDRWAGQAGRQRNSEWGGGCRDRPGAPPPRHDPGAGSQKPWHVPPPQPPPPQFALVIPLMAKMLHSSSRIPSNKCNISSLSPVCDCVTDQQLFMPPPVAPATVSIRLGDLSPPLVSNYNTTEAIGCRAHSAWLPMASVVLNFNENHVENIGRLSSQLIHCHCVVALTVWTLGGHICSF